MLRWIFALLMAAGLQAQELRLQVLASTDMHGHVLPQDTLSLQPEAQGWAMVATLIRERRAANSNTLLLDCGDTIQGEPLDYVRTRLRPDLPEPSLAVMNELGYAAMAVGNHEFDFGMETLRAAEKEARFPFLSANTVFVKDGKPAFTPFVKVSVGGVQVAVLGLTTPGVPRWESPSNFAGLKFLDPVEVARTWVPRLREKEKADVVVVIIHAGLGSLPGRAGDENPGFRLAEEVPGIDLLLLGHTHRATRTSHKGVPILEAQCHGRALAQAELLLAKDQGRWKVREARTELLRPSAATVQDPRVLELTATLRRETDRYLDTFATNLLADLDGRWARIEDSAVMQLVHSVQRAASGAQLSAAGLPFPRYFVPKGPASIRQFWALMPYEDRVARIVITGAQLKAYLEHSARSFGFSHEPELYDPDIPFYNVDTVSGCSYALDLTRPPGQRVVQLRVHGQPVQPGQSFTLALTTFRLCGGGGYMEAIGFKGEPEWISSLGLRNLIFQRVLAAPTLSLAPEENWRTIPFLDRERLLQATR